MNLVFLSVHTLVSTTRLVVMHRTSILYAVRTLGSKYACKNVVTLIVISCCAQHAETEMFVW